MYQKRELPKSFIWLASAIGILVLLSFLSPWLAPHDPYVINSDLILEAPSSEHFFGTDSHGRDIFSRVVVGSRTSILSAFVIILIAGTFGTTVGLLGGYYGGRTDSWLMRLTDVFLAFPDMILAIAVAGILGGGLINAIIALLATTWTQYARLARSSVIAIKNEPFIQAAYLSGCSDKRIIFLHVLPNIIGPLIVTATLHVSSMMMGLAGLSFLGLGVQVPEAEWGSMISEGRDFLQIAPWVALLPSAVMVSVMMVFNFFGDQVRDLFDPKSKNSKSF